MRYVQLHVIFDIYIYICFFPEIRFIYICIYDWFVYLYLYINPYTHMCIFYLYIYIIYIYTYIYADMGLIGEATDHGNILPKI